MTGILRGFDPYMNIVLDDAVEEMSNNKKEPIGMIVSYDLQKNLCSCFFDVEHQYIFVVTKLTLANDVLLMHVLTEERLLSL